MTCTFFGHRDTPESVRPALRKVLTELIEKRGADEFYVGSQGRFDAMVRGELKKLKDSHPQIRYAVVLAYMPGEKTLWDPLEGVETVYPAGLESTPQKFAIDKRNRIMVDWSDIVVTYVRYSWGGAAKFKSLAQRKGKEVIELTDDEKSCQGIFP